MVAGNSAAMLDEYLNNDLPVCMEADSGCWEADFLYRAAWTGRTRSIYLMKSDLMKVMKQIMTSQLQNSRTSRRQYNHWMMSSIF